MTFEWDEAKRLSNLAKHGLDFVDVEVVFAGFTVVIFDAEHSEFEDRWIAIGSLGVERIVAVIHAEPDVDVIRVISFRKADADERRTYEAAIANGLGPAGRNEG